MSVIFMTGADYLSTAQLPWPFDSASGITIDQTGGRFGGGCFVFAGASNPVATKALAWSGTASDAYSYQGFALKFDALEGGVNTLMTLTTNASVFSLLFVETGVLVIEQDGVVVAATKPIANLLHLRGVYIEWKVRLAFEQIALQILVNGQLLANGIPWHTPGTTFQSVTYGGGVSESGQWKIDDCYIVDGAAESVFIYAGRPIFSNTFLGNMHVEGLFATRDGYQANSVSDPGYTPWTPTPGPTHYAMINEHPPNNGTTRESSNQIGTSSGSPNYTLNIYATYGFQHPLQGVRNFGFQAQSSIPWPLYAVQWLGHLASDGTNTMKPTVRQTSNLPSNDVVALGSAVSAASSSYVYRLGLFNRDPIVLLAAGGLPCWTFDAVFAQLTPSLIPREFGVTLAS